MKRCGGPALKNLKAETLDLKTEAAKFCGLKGI
jgi:hypothetical protein